MLCQYIRLYRPLWACAGRLAGLSAYVSIVALPLAVASLAVRIIPASLLLAAPAVRDPPGRLRSHLLIAVGELSEEVFPGDLREDALEVSALIALMGAGVLH